MRSFWKITLGVACGIMLSLPAVFFALSMFMANERAKTEQRAAEHTREADRARQQALSNIEFKDVHNRIMDGRAMLVGRVQNMGTTAVQDLEVVVEWLGAEGEIVDSSWAAITASAEGLKPGAHKPFVVTVVENDWIARDDIEERFRRAGYVFGAFPSPSTVPCLDSSWLEVECLHVRYFLK